jgi:hypothetical protein
VTPGLLVPTIESVVGVVTVIGLLLFAVPGLYAMVVWSQARASIVDGRASCFDALEGSQDLTRGSRGVFAFVLCLIVRSAPLGAFATAAYAALYLELVASAAPLTRAGFFLAPADSPS